MHKEQINRYLGAAQFGVLALLFALPWVSGHALQPVSSKSLSIILEFEFVVLILGWLTAGLFFVPMAVVDSVWLRRVSLLLALYDRGKLLAEVGARILFYLWHLHYRSDNKAPG